MMFVGMGLLLWAFVMMEIFCMGMVVTRPATSKTATTAQQSTMELLLAFPPAS